MEAREKESKSVLLFLGMANHREEAENSSQNIAACWLLLMELLMIGRGGRAQVKVLYGKHVFYSPHLSCPVT